MNEITLIIVGMAVVTYVPRMLPLVLMSKIELSEPIKLWLNYIPISILTALLTVEFLSFEQGTYNLSNKFFLASIPTFLVAIKTKSLLKTVLVGIITMALLNIVFI